VRETVDAFAQDFGFDLDEEGQPLDVDAPLAQRSAQAQDEHAEDKEAQAA